MPDTDAEKVSLEPDSVSFMETLISGKHVGNYVQNGFSPSPLDVEHTDALSGDGVAIQTKTKEEETAPSEPTCPVGLHKAVLLYPVNALL